MSKTRVVSHLQRHYHAPGTAPGTLVMAPITADGEYRIQVIRYTADHLYEKTITDIDDEVLVPSDHSSPEVTWINIEGDYPPSVLQQLGEKYGLHSLSLEDTLNRGHRPKLEEYDPYLFIILYLLARPGRTGN